MFDHEEIDDGVGNLVANFVWVPFGDRLGSENVVGHLVILPPSVTIGLCLEGAFGRYADIGGLLLAQLGQGCADLR